MKEPKIKRRLALAFGWWNYDYKTNTFRQPNYFGKGKHLVVTPEEAMEMGVIVMGTNLLTGTTEFQTRLESINERTHDS